MADVVQFRKPGYRWASGTMRCLRCKHEWVAVRKVPHDPVECPSCGCDTGVPKGVYSPSEQAAHWTCNCGETLFECVVHRNGVEELLCINCGNTKPVRLVDA